MTKYIILWSANGDGEWAQIAGHREGRSARSAIRDYAESEESDHGEGYFAAIPLRSWRPVSVKVETKTALKFS